MLLLLLNYVVLRASWKIDVHLISTLVNKSLVWQNVLQCCVFLTEKQVAKSEHLVLVQNNPDKVSTYRCFMTEIQVKPQTKS